MKHIKFITILSVLIFFSNSAFSQNAMEIVKKADEKFRGKSGYSEMTMTIVRPKWSRTVSFKSCNKGLDYSMTLVTDPAKEKGQTFLKRKNEMWSWNPKIRRLIKLPPSMMSQGWMGSDFSNDDLLKESSIVVDYTHKIVGTETYAGKTCYKIQLIPKEDAAVVWGKLVKWITKDGYLQLKTEYYDEDGYLIKTEKASKIKMMSGREIPTYFELIPEEEPGNKTIVVMDKVVYDINVSENFFSQQNMKKGMTLRFPIEY
ncbi:MAG: outer membrane lipoprotein-sorting protein [Bacteroidales bacterium]|nr:outer membrane lipoprotein-sorting protein [Bacteroidales bacterium]